MECLVPHGECVCVCVACVCLCFRMTVGLLVSIYFAICEQHEQSPLSDDCMPTVELMML